MTQKIITGDGCAIAYRWDGKESRPVLVLSNSIATTHRMWDRQIAELSQLFRVLRYDTRGHGGSTAPVGAYSLDRLGRDVLELLDALHVDRAHFCGLSLGGFIGQWLGFRAPERVSSLILSNTSAFLGPAAQWDRLAKSVLDGRDMATMADMFIGNWFPEQMLTDEPAIITEFRSMIMHTAPEGLAGCFAAVRDADLRRSNSLINTPTLVIGGREDKVTLAAHSEQISRAIPGAELAILPGIHMLNVEQPRAFMSLVLEFLGG